MYLSVKIKCHSGESTAEVKDNSQLILFMRIKS